MEPGEGHLMKERLFKKGSADRGLNIRKPAHRVEAEVKSDIGAKKSQRRSE
jgi:hypothetical protein